MYRIERERRIWKPWAWIIMLTSHGMAQGRCWTKRGCEKALLITQGRWFGEDRF